MDEGYVAAAMPTWTACTDNRSLSDKPTPSKRWFSDANKAALYPIQQVGITQDFQVHSAVACSHDLAFPGEETLHVIRPHLFARADSVFV